ncbi:T9SS type A sorting domain-containing protein [bacterium]|nr:T9SS type A sorting domain-containing protein [bacterium]
MANILDELCITYTTTRQDDDLVYYNLEDYDAVFIALGIQDADDAHIPESSLQQLMAYMDDRYPVYIEGPDFGADYSEGTPAEVEFFERFGISFIDDGVSEEFVNVDFLYHNGPTWFARELVCDYDNGTLADRFVDEIAPNGARILFVDQDGKARASIYTSGYTAIYSACYAGAMDVRGATQARIYDEYVKCFGIISPCDDVRDKEELPSSLELLRAYPNPFNSRCYLSGPDGLKADILDVSGRFIKSIKLPGFWYGENEKGEVVGSGIYFIKTHDENERIILYRLLLIK